VEVPVDFDLLRSLFILCLKTSLLTLHKAFTGRFLGGTAEREALPFLSKTSQKGVRRSPFCLLDIRFDLATILKRGC
jgi:hypothetical protein